jgi:peptidoglycan/LPS O-acetylase OafA/YrhL
MRKRAAGVPLRAQAKRQRCELAIAWPDARPPPTARLLPARPVHGDQFNLLRLSFAGAVLFSHCFELIDRGRIHEPLDRLFHTFSAGDLAVDGFFMLSGYLILQSWTSDPHPGRYLARRALRIYPAFLVVTLVGLVLGRSSAAARRTTSGSSAARFHGGRAAVARARRPAGVHRQSLHRCKRSLWTIQYEFMCYVIVLIGGLLARNRRAFWWVLWLAALALNSLAGEALERIRFPGSRILLGDEPAAFVRFLGFFGAGVLCYLHRDRLRFRAAPALLCSVALILSLFDLGAAVLVLRRRAPISNSGTHSAPLRIRRSTASCSATTSPTGCTCLPGRPSRS